MALFNFNANDVEYDQNPNLSDGFYNVQIAKVKMKKSKSGSAKMLEVIYKVNSEFCKGALIRDNIIYDMPSSEEAQRIGRQKLGRILFFIGRPEITDTDQMLRGELQVKIEMMQGDKQIFPEVLAVYETNTNELTKGENKQGASCNSGTTQQAQQQTQAPPKSEDRKTLWS